MLLLDLLGQSIKMCHEKALPNGNATSPHTHPTAHTLILLLELWALTYQIKIKLKDTECKSLT